MPTTMYLADKSDTTKRLFDFADPTGLNNLGLVQTRLTGVDAGSYTPEMGLFAPDTGDGSFRTKRRAPSTQMLIQLRTTATSQDNHRKAMNRLFSLMEIPRVIVYQGEGMAEAVHIFTLGMQVEQLLRGGQQNWDLIVRQFQDVSMDLNIDRQPIILLANELLSATNTLTNGMFMYDQSGTDGAVTGLPDGWVWRTAAGVLDATTISAGSTGGTGDGYSFSKDTAAAVRVLTQDEPAAVGQTWSAQFQFEALANALTAQAFIYFFNGGILVGTFSGPLTAGVVGSEILLKVEGAVAPAATTTARIGISINTTTATAKPLVIRRAQLEQGATISRFRSGNETIPNDLRLSRGRNYYFWNDGEASVPVKTTSVIDAVGTPFVTFEMIGKRSQFGVTGLRRMGDLQETRYIQPEVTQRGWTITLGAGTTKPGFAADPDASGVTTTNFVQISHATTPGISARRVRATRTTKLDSLRGRFKVYGRFRPAPGGGNPPTTSTPRQFGVQLRWSPSLQDPAINVEPEQVVDNITRVGDGAVPTLVAGFVEVELGSIELPTETNVGLGGIALEVWTRVILPEPAVATALDLDLLWLVPADAASNEDSIGSMFVTGAGSQRTIGKDLTTPPLRLPPAGDPVWVAGQLQGNVRRLRAAAHAVGLGPNLIGLVFGVGKHRVTWSLNDRLTGTHTVIARVTDVTGSSEVPLTRSVFTSATAAKVPPNLVVEWTGVGGIGYQPIVGITVYGSGTPGNAGYLDVLSVVYEFIPSAVAGEAFRSDPGDRYVVERLDASSNLLSIVDASGEVPFFSDRGLNFLSVRQDEVPLQFYLDRQNKTARIPALSFAYRPGFYEL